MRKRSVKQVSTPGSQLSPVHGYSSHVDGQLFSSQDDVQSSSSQFSSSQMDHQDAQLSHVDGQLSSILFHSHNISLINEYIVTTPSQLHSQYLQSHLT